jgi:ATP-binding cassette subfamily C protein
MAGGESAFWMIRSMIDSTSSERELDSGSLEPPPLSSEIRLANVCFRHGSHIALDDVSLTIPAGALVAIVGPSGAGKSTLADLIAGLYRPDSGVVTIDGVGMSEISIRRWRDLVGYVPQEPLLLHDSVFANVAMGDPLITRADVEAALRDADAWSFVQDRGALEAPVGERGGMLSGGQRQRIALARALVRKPALLVLDEVTAGLDAVTETAIFHTLRRLRGRVTVLFVSHRSAVTELADLVVHMDTGRATTREAPTRAARSHA